MNDYTIGLISSWLFDNNECEYGLRKYADEDAKKLVNYLLANGVCMIERETGFDRNEINITKELK